MASEIVRGNIMQRLYDLLPAEDCEPEAMLTIDAMAAALPFTADTLREALRRLRRLRCVRAACIDGAWRYGRRKGAVRPADSRGRKRR